MMVEAAISATFGSWQERARGLLAAGTPPHHVVWVVGGEHPLLPLAAEKDAGASSPRVRVSKRFVDLARIAACHRAPDRWSLLYRVLWRLVHDDRELLDSVLDADVARLTSLVQQVRQDMHRMQAFVRFRRIRDGNAERLISWYNPQHDVAALVAPHFAARYPKVNWSIFTPQASVHWTAGQLAVDGGVDPSAWPRHDSDEEAENLWRVYYRAAFNPARLNERKLVREMPTRFWDTLPEAKEIPSLVAAAPAVTAALRTHSGGATNRAVIPAAGDIKVLREAAAHCRSCGLHEHATQTVFGEGPVTAPLMLVGEQPGDTEDRSGHPFVGPAGEVLDRAFAAVGLQRGDVYLTNAVKHFGWEPRGKWRIHRTPRLSEIHACRPWLEHELALVKPRVLVLLGGVAARALLGPQTRVAAVRGRILSTPWASSTLVTYHPSAVLRAGEGDMRDRLFESLTADLSLAVAHLAQTQTRAAG
jgi:uracil-DNA glycosylase